MLNGVAPLLLFNFYKTIDLGTFNFASGLLSGIKVPLLPVPIYLDENFTQVALDDHSRHISVDVDQDANKQFQKVNSIDTTLSFRAPRENVVVTALLALFEVVIDKVMAQDYGVSVFYDEVMMLNASLKSLDTTIEPDTNIREIIVTFTKRPQKKIDPIDIFKDTSGGKPPIGG